MILPIRTAHDTRQALARAGLCPLGVQWLAWLEGAAATLPLGERTVFYRRTHVLGPIEAAMALRDADGCWTLSGWITRSVPRLPPDVQPLAQPTPLD